MEDPKIIAAIITASIALFLGLVNLIFNIVALKSRNRNQKEVEKLKLELEKDKINYQESLKKKELEVSAKTENEKRILNVLQVLKDSSYSILNNLAQPEEQYSKSLENFKLSLSSVIGIYQETYMDLDDRLRDEMHETKNLLHAAKMNVEKELLLISRKIKNRKRIDEKEINRLIARISTIQTNLLIQK